MIRLEIYRYEDQLLWELYRWKPLVNAAHYSQHKAWTRNGSVARGASTGDKTDLRLVLEELLELLRKSDAADD